MDGLGSLVTTAGRRARRGRGPPTTARCLLAQRCRSALVRSLLGVLVLLLMGARASRGAVRPSVHPSVRPSVRALPSAFCGRRKNHFYRLEIFVAAVTAAPPPPTPPPPPPSPGHDTPSPHWLPGWLGPRRRRMRSLQSHAGVRRVSNSPREGRLSPN